MALRLLNEKEYTENDMIRVELEAVYWQRVARGRRRGTKCKGKWEIDVSVAKNGVFWDYFHPLIIVSETSSNRQCSNKSLSDWKSTPLKGIHMKKQDLHFGT